jgi:hypothetical protein
MVSGFVGALAIATTCGLLGFGALALFSAVRTRSAPRAQHRPGVRSKRLQRSTLTAAAVAPGGVLLGWTLAIGAFGMPTGLLLGLIPAAGFAAAVAFLAFTVVQLTKREYRTPMALLVGTGVNVAYLIVLWRFIVSLNPA